MDKTTLVEADLKTGWSLVEKMEQDGITVDAAAWLLDDSRGTWQLLVASPDVETSGSRQIYQYLHDVLSTSSEIPLELDDILVASSQDRLVTDLQRLVRTGNEPQLLRLYDLELGGRQFAALRIYRVRGDGGLDGVIEDGARVRVRATGQLGVVRGMTPAGGPPRYFVLFDLTPGDLDATRREPPLAGREYAERELEFLYAIRPSGQAEQPPPIRRSA